MYLEAYNARAFLEQYILILLFIIHEYYYKENKITDKLQYKTTKLFYIIGQCKFIAIMAFFISR